MEFCITWVEATVYYMLWTQSLENIYGEFNLQSSKTMKDFFMESASRGLVRMEIWAS